MGDGGLSLTEAMESLRARLTDVMLRGIGEPMQVPRSCQPERLTPRSGSWRRHGRN